VLATVKGTALGGLLILVVVGHTTAPSARPDDAPEDDAYQGVVQRAVAGAHCSYTGFDDARLPASALIRTARGKLRMVTFEIGWEVYNGKRPGTLIAVCPDDPSGGLVQVLR